MGIEEISALAAVDLDEFYVEKSGCESCGIEEKRTEEMDFEFVGKDMNRRVILIGSNGLRLRI